MGIVQRIKESVSKFVKPRPKPNEQVSYTTQTTEKYQDEGGKDVVVTATKVSDQPQRKPIVQRIKERLAKHEENTKRIIGETKQAIIGASRVASHNAVKSVYDKGKQNARQANTFVGKVVTAAERAPQKLVAVASNVASKVQIKRDPLAIPGNAVITAFTGIRAGEKNPYTKKDKATLYGRKISKKEEKELRKKYGRNWRMAMKQDRQRRLYTATSPFQRAQIKRENKLDQVSVNFGDQFPQPSVFITSGESRVPFAKRSDDPFDVDAMFMGGSHVITKRGKDPFNIDANFKGKLKL